MIPGQFTWMTLQLPQIKKNYFQWILILRTEEVKTCRVHSWDLYFFKRSNFKQTKKNHKLRRNTNIQYRKNCRMELDKKRHHKMLLGFLKLKLCSHIVTSSRLYVSSSTDRKIDYQFLCKFIHLCHDRPLIKTNRSGSVRVWVVDWECWFIHSQNT